MTDPPVQGGGASSIPTSLTLLEKVRQKDQASWERLVSLYTPLVWHWCRRAGLQAADAEEIGQEVFIAVARSVVNFDHERSGATFRGWLRTITRRKIFDHVPPLGGVGIGARKNWLELIPAVDPPDEDDPAVTIEKGILYRRAIELIEISFEPRTLRAFWRLVAGLTPDEVAAELKMTRAAVYTARSKIMKRLQDEFHDLLGLTDSGEMPRPNKPDSDD